MNPIQLTLPQQSGNSALFSALRPGHAARGIVVASGSTLSVRVGTSLIPLPESATFQTGARVEVALISRGGANAVEVRPASQTFAASTAPTSNRGGLESLLATVLAARHANVTAAELGSILPGRLPTNPQFVQQLVDLFLARTPMADQVHQIAGSVQAAIDAGWTASLAAQQFLESYQRWTSSSGIDRLRHLVQWIRARSEATLARSGQAPSQPTELLAQLRMLQNDHNFLARLSGRAARESIQEIGDLSTRLESQQIQNLHNLDQFYFFFEIPFDDTELPAQIHWLRDRGCDEGDNNDTIHIDVVLSRLGNVWIDLVLAKHCQCTLKFEEEEAIECAASGKGALEQALRDLGYEPVSVVIEKWSGNAVNELGGAAFARKSMDLQA